MGEIVLMNAGGDSLGARLVHEGAWQEYQGDTAYRCRVALAADSGGVVATTTLPGVIVSGVNEKDALDKVTAALASAILRHKAAGESIPWVEAELPAEATVRWVIVDLNDWRGLNRPSVDAPPPLDRGMVEQSRREREAGLSKDVRDIIKELDNNPEAPPNHKDGPSGG